MLFIKQATPRSWAHLSQESVHTQSEEHRLITSRPARRLGRQTPHVAPPPRHVSPLRRRLRELAVQAEVEPAGRVAADVGVFGQVRV